MVPVIELVEHYKNKMKIKRGQSLGRCPKASAQHQIPASGPRHFARRIEGPVAIKADHAPLHPISRADQTTVLDDRVIDRPLDAIGHEHHRLAEPARDGGLDPGTECDLAHLLELDDLEIGGPEPALLAAEID